MRKRSRAWLKRFSGDGGGWSKCFPPLICQHEMPWLVILEFAHSTEDVRRKSSAQLHQVFQVQPSVAVGRIREYPPMTEIRNIGSVAQRIGSVAQRPKRLQDS